MNPCSGSIDHGFYQFSPTLYFDYFSANGFAVVGCYLDEPLRYSPLDKRKGRIFRYEYVDGEHPIVSSTGIDLVFFATREIIGEADGSHKPNQSLWKNVWASSLEKVDRATASPPRKVGLSPLHEGVTTGNTP